MLRVRGQQELVNRRRCSEEGREKDRQTDRQGERERGREIIVVMGLMCNKLHEGAFRETFSTSTHNIPRKKTHTHTHKV